MTILLLALLALAAGAALDLRRRLRVERARPCAMCALHVAARMALRADLAQETLRADLAQERRVSAEWRAEAARQGALADAVSVSPYEPQGDADPEAVTVETGAIR